MSKELEVKVLNIDKDEIERKIKDIGGVLIKKEYQINTIFDKKDKCIENIHNGYLRIRESRDLMTNKTTYYLTLKKNIKKEGLRENLEIETVIKDKESLKIILQHLDLDVVHEGTKERTSYVYKDIRFDIDTWDKNTYPSPYLEIEVEKEEDLSLAIELLKLNKQNITTKSIGQLRSEIGLEDL